MIETYTQYVIDHKRNVYHGYLWCAAQISEVIVEVAESYRDIDKLMYTHDSSKFTEEELEPYARYFYGPKEDKDKPEVKESYDEAWRIHVRRNPHHWQHWYVAPDTAVEMPKHFVFEMVMDWWAFSWSSDNLYEIFDWYKRNENVMVLHPKTRYYVEYLLGRIKARLDILARKEEVDNV